MSDVDLEDVTVSESDVTVRKSLNADQFQTLAVVFDVRSERDEEARLQLVDTIPDEVSTDDVGFHPDYGGEHWAIGEGEVVFERTFEPGEEYTTIYGLRDAEAGDIGSLSPPGVDLVGTTAEENGSTDGDGSTADAAEDDDPLDETVTDDLEGLDDLVSAESSDIVRDVISGERDAIPGMGDDDLAEVEVGEPAGAGSAPTEAAVDLDAGADAEGEPFADVEGEPFADAEGEPFADVEAGGGTGADVDAEPAAEPAETGAETGAVEDEPAEVEEVEPPEADSGASAEPTGGEREEEPAVPGGADPEAVEAAEAVADGNDTPADEVTVPVTGGVVRVLVKELREGSVPDEDRKLLRDELAFVEGSTEARIQHLQSTVADLEAYTGALEAFLDEEGSAQELFDDLRGSMDGLADDVARIEKRLDQNADAIDSVQESLAQLEGDLDDIDGEIDRVDEEMDRVGGVEDRVDDLEDDLGRVRQTTDSVADQLEDMAAFRERLATVLGGSAESDEGG